jgi:hypothetical protein
MPRRVSTSESGVRPSRTAEPAPATPRRAATAESGSTRVAAAESGSVKRSEADEAPWAPKKKAATATSPTPRRVRTTE